VREHAEKRRDEAVHRYREHGSPDMASADLRSILPAAYEGRVHTLFIAVGEYRWGTFNPRDISVELHEKRKNGDHDLLDQAAVYTLANGGTVYPVSRHEVPEGAMAAALFRYGDRASPGAATGPGRRLRLTGGKRRSTVQERGCG
jgi:hypothetical protein